MSTRCKSCRTEFTVYWTWRHRCAYCHKDFCDKCSERYVHPRPAKRSENREELCVECYGNLRRAVDDVLVVKGHHVGGHRITKNVCEIETWVPRDNVDNAVWDAQLLAHHHGGNALIRMRVSKGTQSEPSDNGKGTHYYSVSLVRGLAVVVQSVG